MRFAHAAFFAGILLTPLVAFGASAALESSPFANLNPFFLEDSEIEMSLDSFAGQTGAAALPAGLKKEMCSDGGEQKIDLSKGCYQGSKNICTSETMTVDSKGALFVKTK